MCHRTQRYRENWPAPLGSVKGGTPLNSLTQGEIQQVLDVVIQDVTRKMAAFDLQKVEEAFSDQAYTVHVDVYGCCDTTLTLWMEPEYLYRLSQQMLQEEQICPQDMEDVAKEYINVIGGQLIAHLFPKIRRSVRFCLPQFYVGQWLPNRPVGRACRGEYANQFQERAVLLLTHKL